MVSFHVVPTNVWGKNRFVWTLQIECLLPAAPGMMTTLIKPSDDAKDDSSSLEHNKTPQRVMVHAYYRDKDVYVISSMLHDATTKTRPL